MVERVSKFEREIAAFHGFRPRRLRVSIDVPAAQRQKRWAELDWFGKAFVVLVLAALSMVGLAAGAFMVIFAGAIV